MEWIAYDQVREDMLPEWTQGTGRHFACFPHEVRLYSSGIVLKRRRKHSALQWRDILVPIRPDPQQFLIAAARQPPLAPWFEITAGPIDALEKAIRQKLDSMSAAGYRDVQRANHRPLSSEELFERVISRKIVAGAVSIPPAAPGPKRVVESIIMGGIAGSITGAVAFGPLGFLGGAILGGGGWVGADFAIRHELSSRKRVLVLTPDGFVAGLDGGEVKVVMWGEVGGFGASEDKTVQQLSVYNLDGSSMVTVPGHFFGASLKVIVSVAEAYRRKAMGL